MASLGSLTAISIVRYFTVVRPFNMGNLTNRGVAIAVGKFVTIHSNYFKAISIFIEFKLEVEFE